MGKIKNLRLLVQLGFTALTNGYVTGFVQGKIFTGLSKAACLPGLNCYSCPGALVACPIGSLQAVLNSREYHVSFYIVGFLVIFGALMGRLICGWLCPFGLIEDLLHKIPFPKKLRKFPGDRWLRHLKVAILAGFVILLPMFLVDAFGQGQPWFCKLICPSGTAMAGLPLLAVNGALRDIAGWLFAWKGLLLGIIVLLSIIVYRPFCRYLCPLGAIYGWFNPIALYRYQVDEEKCTRCGHCQRTCKMDIDIYRHPNTAQCIRCGDCLKACPHGALQLKYRCVSRAQERPGQSAE